ncbi:HAD hydrolase-like protein [Paenibacillus chitinolyticus]|uniref:HAD hydrolase-like protein n=1 Tax=Paenibacillus chitinolyticus TaxID=79263 RepID=UPI0038644022
MIKGVLFDLDNTLLDRTRTFTDFSEKLMDSYFGQQEARQAHFTVGAGQAGAAADEAVFVGDHPRNDIWGAGQAGIRGIWLQRIG